MIILLFESGNGRIFENINNLPSRVWLHCPDFCLSAEYGGFLFGPGFMLGQLSTTKLWLPALMKLVRTFPETVY